MERDLFFFSTYLDAGALPEQSDCDVSCISLLLSRNEQGLIRGLIGHETTLQWHLHHLADMDGTGNLFLFGLSSTLSVKVDLIYIC